MKKADYTGRRDAMGGPVLVTGATGFIGGRLAEMLVEQGWPVRLLVRRPQALRASLKKCEVIEGDLSNEQALAGAVQGASYVYHCAANVATWDDFDAYYESNVVGLERLLQQLVQQGSSLQRFVHFSTVDVYGFPRTPCDENAPQSTNAFGYGETKRLAEQLVRRLGDQSDLPFTILRPCNVIGPGSPFISRIGKELASGLMLTIDHGTANAGLVYVDNLVRYALCLAQCDGAVGQAFNLRDPYDVSWSRFLSDFKSQIEGKGWVLDLPYALAHFAANAFAGLHRGFRIHKEPLLHPLLVNIFGRTCGHHADRALHLCQLRDGVDYETAIKRSCEWFERNRVGQ